MTCPTTENQGSHKFTDDSLTIGDLCTAKDRIYAIIPSKPSVKLPLDIAALCPELLTGPLLDKTAKSKQISVSTIEILKREIDEHAMEKSRQDKRMEEIMTEVKSMIDKSTEAERRIAEKRLKEERAKADAKLACELAKCDEKLARGLKEERAKADAKLACELAKADEKLARGLKEERAKADAKLACELAKADAKLAEELTKANKRIDELQSKLHSSNDRADEMSYKLQEVDAVTMDTLEWISCGVRPGSNQHLPELT